MRDRAAAGVGEGDAPPGGGMGGKGGGQVPAGTGVGGAVSGDLAWGITAASPGRPGHDQGHGAGNGTSVRRAASGGGTCLGIPAGSTRVIHAGGTWAVHARGLAAAACLAARLGRGPIGPGGGLIRWRYRRKERVDGLAVDYGTEDREPQLLQRPLGAMAP